MEQFLREFSENSINIEILSSNIYRKVKEEAGITFAGIVVGIFPGIFFFQELFQGTIGSIFKESLNVSLLEN